MANSTAPVSRRLAQGWWLCAILFAWLLVHPVLHVQAQPLEAPLEVNAEAELIFRQALDAFEAGNYGMAHRRFRVVYSDFPLHRSTTAAYLMAGKSLYANREYERAITLLREFQVAFPGSSYLDAAQRTIAFAIEADELDRATQDVIRLGIALPLDENARFTQALFTGIRIAVEDFNAEVQSVLMQGAPYEEGQSEPSRPVQMFFEDSKARSAAATMAVSRLTEARVDVILGPLFSDEARAAAAAAESARIPLIAPLATDADVSAGRRYVFQANPTMAMRGRLMARFATQSLGLRRLGVIAELGDQFGEQMAEGFQDEALRLGADVRFFELLPNSSTWYRLNSYYAPDSLRGADAVYLPISGAQSVRKVNAALTGVHALSPSVRILGNKTWHDQPFRSRASEHTVTYSNDYFLQESPALDLFLARYESVTGNDLRDRRFADEARLVYLGYDLTRFLLTELNLRPGAPVDEILRNAPQYEGLATRIEFGGGNVNQALYYHRYRDSQLTLIR